MTLRILALALALLWLGASSAHAAGTEVSLDGRHWSAGLSRPLFDPALRWVPGDARTASLWVRNEGETTAALTLAMRAADADGLIAHGVVRIEAQAGDGPWVPIDPARPGRRLAGDLGVGAQERITVRASYDPAADNDTQRDRVELSFQVTLSDATAAGPAAGSGSAAGSTPTGTTPTGGQGAAPAGASLAATGAPDLGRPVAAGVAALVVGSTLLRRRRRRPRGTMISNGTGRSETR